MLFSVPRMALTRLVKVPLHFPMGRNPPHSSPSWTSGQTGLTSLQRPRPPCQLQEGELLICPGAFGPACVCSGLPVSFQGLVVICAAKKQLLPLPGAYAASSYSPPDWEARLVLSRGHGTYPYHHHHHRYHHRYHHHHHWQTGMEGLDLKHSWQSKHFS